jgi:membrane fusion protein (multidrug efflux system)
MVAEVRPQVSGIIKERLFEEGADVISGQALYRIDPELYRAAFTEAEAALRKAEANAEAANLRAKRYSALAKSGAVGIQERDDAVSGAEQADAQVLSARAALETAAINLGYTEIRSPVSGRIGKSFVTPGALVTTNQMQPLAVVQQLSPVYVDVTQSTAELITLREELAGGGVNADGLEGITVRLILENGSPYARLAAKPGPEPERLEGRLMFSDVTVQQSTGVVTLRATIDNPDELLLPGMYVRAILHAGFRENAILAPQKAVFRDNKGRAQVYVLSKEAGADLPEAERRSLAANEYYVRLRPIVLGGNNGPQWLVESGLEEGELLLVEGTGKARPGVVVTALPVANSATPSPASGGR